MRYAISVLTLCALILILTSLPAQALDLDKILHSIQLTSGYSQGFSKADELADKGYGLHTGVIAKFPLGSPHVRLGIEFQYNYHKIEETDELKVVSDWGMSHYVQRGSGFIDPDTGERLWGSFIASEVDRLNGTLRNVERLIHRPIIISLEFGKPFGNIEPFVGFGVGLYTFKGTLSHHQDWDPEYDEEGVPPGTRYPLDDKAYHLIDRSGQAWGGMIRGGVNMPINDWLAFTARIDYHILGEEEKFFTDRDQIWYDQPNWPTQVTQYKKYREQNPILDILRFQNWLNASLGFSFYYK